MPKNEKLSHDEAEEEAFLIQQNLKKNEKPSEEGGFTKEQYQHEYVWGTPRDIRGIIENLTTYYDSHHDDIKIEKRISDALKKKEWCDLPDILFKRAVAEAIPDLLSRGRLSDVLSLKEKFLSGESFNQIIKEYFVKSLSKGCIKNVLNIQQNKDFPQLEDLIDPLEIKQLEKQGLVYLFEEKYSVQSALNNKVFANFSEKDMEDEEIKKAIENSVDYISGCISKRRHSSSYDVETDINQAQILIDGFGVEPSKFENDGISFINSELSEHKKYRQKNDYKRYLGYVNQLRLPMEKVQQIILQSINKAYIYGIQDCKNVVDELSVFGLEDKKQYFGEKYLLYIPIEEVEQVAEIFNLPIQIIEKIGEERIKKLLSEKKYELIPDLAKTFAVPEEAVENLIASEVIIQLENEKFSKASELLGKFKQFEGVKDLPEVKKAALEQFIKFIARGNIDEAFSIGDKFNVPEEVYHLQEVEQAGQKAIILFLEQGNAYKACGIKQKLNLSENSINSADIQKASYKGVECILSEIKYSSNPESDDSESYGQYIDFYDAQLICKEFNLSDEDFKKVAYETMINLSMEGKVDNVKMIKKELNFSEEIDIKYLTPLKKSLVEVFKLNNIQEFSKFCYYEIEFIEYLNRTPDSPLSITEDDLSLLDRLYISFKEAEELKRSGADLADLSENKNYEELFEMLKTDSESWQDEQNIIKPFEQGAEVFGAEKMFIYLDRPGFSRHDGLHGFRNVIGLYEASGLSPKQFYGNILSQVNVDGSGYEAGSAHHQLNSIAQALDVNIENVLEQAKQYKNIIRLQELINNFNSAKVVFSSWNNLKRYSELTQILERTEILDQLKELKTQGRDKLYEYVETIAFHPSSKVAMSKVFEFWHSPERFLGGNDEHTPEEVHNRKKPSNYVEIPNLDLTAEELRDALVEGKMDSIQAFTPMEIEYRIPTGETYPLALREQTKKALGSFRENIQGEAKDPKKLFVELQKVFKKHKLNLQDYLNGMNLPQEKLVEIEKEISGLVENPEIGLVKAENQEQVFVAKINRKSDPDGVLAGNDTACCMPFGSGKNTVYTFNPDTSLFTLQIKRPDGNLRTIAQSVLTKDKDVKILVPKILEKMEQVGEKIDDLLSEDSLNESLAYLACDNVEVAENFKTKEYDKIIEQVYRDFFAEYMKQFGNAQGLFSDEIIIGLGYSDSLTHLPKKANTFVPLAPVGYSDKTHSEVYTLDLNKKEQELKRNITIPKISKLSQTSLPDVKGLSYLTFQDTLAVAYLEGKAYSDNSSLIEYLHNVENCLIAKDINNVAKGRQNMCLKYVDTKGKMRSYITAYEGKMGEGYQENQYDGYEERQENGERIVYIEDFASDKKSPLASGKLLKSFVELYKKNYLDKNDLIPIYAQAREQTSYVLIQRNLNDMAKSIGINFELEELEPYRVGPDTMHPVIIRPKKL